MDKDNQIFQEFNEYIHLLLTILEKLQKEGNYLNISSISNTALAVLMCIPKEGSRNYKEITQKLGLPKSTLTGVAHLLESKGYIVQKVNEQDKRRHDLFLTEKGKITQDEHDACEKQTYTILTGNLDLNEKEKLLSLLSKGLTT